MGFTTNLSLDKLDQGQVRFDTAMNSALDKLDACFKGTTASILGIGHASKSIITLNPGGVESARLDATLLTLASQVGMKLGNFQGTPGAGIMRWSGTDFEGYDGTTWKSFTAGGGGGGGVSGSGTTGRLAAWTGATALGDAPFMTVKRVINWASGLRTVYTVPDGQKAILIAPYWHSESTNGTLYLVPNGGAAGAGNRLINNQTYATNAALFAFRAVLNEGDFIVFDSGGSTVTFAGLVFEYTAGSMIDQFIKIFKSNVSTASRDTLYTVPAGKQAAGGAIGAPTPQRLSGMAGESFWVHNTGAGSSQLTLYVHDGTADREIWSEAMPAGKMIRIYKPMYGLGMEAGNILKAQASVAGLNLWASLTEW